MADVAAAIEDWFEDSDKVHDYLNPMVDLIDNTLKTPERPEITVNMTSNLLTIEPLELLIET